MIKLLLPYPVSTNRMWRQVTPKGGGRAMTILSPDGKAYKQTVALEARVQGVKTPTDKLLTVRYWLCWPTHRKDGAKAGPGIDLSNAWKVAEDALQGIAYVNDRQVKDLHARYGNPTKSGALLVEIEEFLPENQPLVPDFFDYMHGDLRVQTKQTTMVLA